jgi:hypothetical protein
MYGTIVWLNALLTSRKLCLNWPRLPIALIVAVLVVAGFALTVALGGGEVHHVVSASSVAWGKQG